MWSSATRRSTATGRSWSSPTRLTLTWRGAHDRRPADRRRLRAARRAAGRSRAVLVAERGRACLAACGLNYLGAVYVPVNMAYRGALLQHVVALSGRALMVADGGLAPRLAEIEPARLAAGGGDRRGAGAVAGLHGSGPALTDRATRAAAARVRSTPGTRRRRSSPPAPPARPRQCCVPTRNGGRMRRKGAYIYVDDRQMVTLPLFHVGGTRPVQR